MARRVIEMTDTSTDGSDFSCPVCEVPPMDVNGFRKAGETNYDGTVFDVYQCWSCNVRFAVGVRSVDTGAE